MSRWVDWTLDFLFPPKCIFCRKLLQKGEEDYCTSCKLDLPENDRLHLIPGADTCRAPLRYEGMARDAMLRYKFGGCTSYAKSFAKLLVPTATALPADVITWVPVSFRRRLERGYDQTELLALELSRLTGIPAVKLLRKKHTKRQSGVGGPAQREKNIRGAFSVPNPAEVRGKQILLLDDICTTGATMAEAAGTLNHFGAAEIHCAVLMMTQE